MLRTNPRQFIEKLRVLPRAERRFAARAWLLAPLVEGSLTTLGMQRTLRVLEALFQVAPAPDPDMPAAGRAGQLVDAAYGCHLLRGACLPRALIQYGLMRRGGHHVRFVIGVNNDAGFRAHAWVESTIAGKGAARGRPATDVSFEPLMEAGA
jgi:hypothetical protein